MMARSPRAAAADTGLCPSHPRSKRPRLAVVGKGLGDRLRAEAWGQAAVEFAVATPLILLLLLGIFDFGRAVVAQSCLANAVHEGARTALYSSASDEQVRATVRAQAYIASDLADDQIAITPTGSRDPGTTVTVAVTYSFIPATPFIGSLLPEGKITLRAAASTIAQ